MKNYEILSNDGYRIRVMVFNQQGITELEKAGYWFDDFYGDGTERWTR